MRGDCERPCTESTRDGNGGHCRHTNTYIRIHTHFTHKQWARWWLINAKIRGVLWGGYYTNSHMKVLRMSLLLYEDKGNPMGPAIHVCAYAYLLVFPPSACVKHMLGFALFFRFWRGVCPLGAHHCCSLYNWGWFAVVLFFSKVLSFTNKLSVVFMFYVE